MNGCQNAHFILQYTSGFFWLSAAMTTLLLFIYHVIKLLYSSCCSFFFFALVLLELQPLPGELPHPTEYERKNSDMWRNTSTNGKRPIDKKKKTHALCYIDNLWREIERRTKWEISINFSTFYIATKAKAKATSHFTKTVKWNWWWRQKIHSQSGNIGMAASEWVHLFTNHDTNKIRKRTDRKANGERSLDSYQDMPCIIITVWFPKKKLPGFFGSSGNGGRARERKVNV